MEKFTFTFEKKTIELFYESGIVKSDSIQTSESTSIVNNELVTNTSTSGELFIMNFNNEVVSIPVNTDNNIGIGSIASIIYVSPDSGKTLRPFCIYDHERDVVRVFDKDGHMKHYRTMIGQTGFSSLIWSKLTTVLNYALTIIIGGLLTTVLGLAVGGGPGAILGVLAAFPILYLVGKFVVAPIFKRIPGSSLKLLMFSDGLEKEIRKGLFEINQKAKKVRAALA
ncbi:hypothetical protein ACED25_12155 [Vibrio sp. 1F263]|uniref:hypothetical protein n=1 Tax=Vibrio sp. 1F263 TaxID=3230012 RepID=UPI00352FC29D